MYFTKRVLDFPLDDNNILLINTISSAMDIVDKTIYSSIQKIANGEKVENKQLLDQLIQRGYVFENEECERMHVEKCAKIHKEAMKKNFIRNYTICPTMGCNLRCIYCFEGDENHCNNQLMSKDKLDSILCYIDKEIHEAERDNMHKSVSISLYGGEPLLPNNKELVETTLKFAHDRNIEVRIITNGTTIFHYLEMLKKYPDTVIQITLDGDKTIHDKRRITANKRGTFDEIVTGIDSLVMHGIKVYLRTNVDGENIHSIPKLIELIKHKKWIETELVYPYVAPVFDYCNGSDNSMKESDLYRELLEIEPNFGSDNSIIKRISSPCLNFLQSFFSGNQQIKPWKFSYCEATSGGNLVFSPDGDISTCLMLAGKRKNQIGYVDKNEVVFYPKEVKQWSTRDILHLSKCNECKYGLICGGGCPIAALDINSDISCPVCSDIEDTIKVFIESKKTEILKRL